MKLPQNLWEKAGIVCLRLSQNLKRNNFTGILLFIILLALPFQFGKHFWPQFSFVSGQRIDYLSPTLYISDILILLLFLVTVFQKKLRIERVRMLGLLAIILYLSLGIFLSLSPFAGWYALAKLMEYAFLVWVIVQKGKTICSKLFWAFGIGIVVEGVLGTMEFVKQGSLGGFWYFLGERTFSASTPGIANASVHGQLFLRPYATFPHPNVFAGYLVIALLFFLCFLFSKTMPLFSAKKVIAFLVLVFGSCVLLLTLSRTSIAVFVLVSLLFFLVRFPKRRLMITAFYIFSFSILFFLPTLITGRFSDVGGYAESLILRVDLLQAAWQMFLSHSLLGVGLGNFLPNLPFYASAPVSFGFVQPVHNIFLLVLAETGIPGLALLLLLFALAFAESLKKLKANPLFPFSFFSLLAIFCIGMTDHYFLTLQQGQLLLSLILGLCFLKKS